MDDFMMRFAHGGVTAPFFTTRGINMEQANNKVIDTIVMILTMAILLTTLPLYADMVQPIYEYFTKVVY